MNNELFNIHSYDILCIILYEFIHFVQNHIITEQCSKNTESKSDSNKDHNKIILFLRLVISFDKLK